MKFGKFLYTVLMIKDIYQMMVLIAMHWYVTDGINIYVLQTDINKSLIMQD